MPARRDLLVSDAERDSVAGFLQSHYTAGRLTHDELSARVEATYLSRWRSQLLALTQDLPPVPPEAPPAPKRRVRALPVTLALLVLTILASTWFVSALPDELQLLIALFVVPMLVALAVVIVPVVLMIAGLRWLLERLPGHSYARRLGT